MRLPAWTRILAGIGLRSMDEQAVLAVAESRRRFQVLLMGWFAVLAAVLAAIGIYGVMVNTVVRRTREIGLRLALGAAPRDAVTMIVSNGMLLAGAGIAAGFAAAIALMRFHPDHSVRCFAVRCANIHSRRGTAGADCFRLGVGSGLAQRRGSGSLWSRLARSIPTLRLAASAGREGLP